MDGKKVLYISLEMGGKRFLNIMLLFQHSSSVLLSLSVAQCVVRSLILMVRLLWWSEHMVARV